VGLAANADEEAAKRYRELTGADSEQAMEVIQGL
jgi:hypothetical protein